ncbi:MAG: hypothetical protein IT160_19670 [Bryobacterales bacterium]|nr:hypothetical protein [Bryobacterales bacterium]
MTTYQAQALDTKALKALYSTDPVAKIILEDFGARQRNQQITKLDQLLFRLSNARKSVSRADAINVLRSLDDAGCGRFLTGRKGHPTRFEWQYDLVSVAKAATGEVQQVEEIQPAPQTDNGDEPIIEKESLPEGTIKHTYQLRADWQVTLALPSDLTAREAARLSEFIKTLPFDGQEA